MTGLLVLLAFAAAAELPVLDMSRAEAERDALSNSKQLKSIAENKSAAEEQTRAEYANLFPRLSLTGYYRYIGVVPKLDTPGTDFNFGAHNNYAIGPMITYTLWDTYSARKSYRSAGKLTDSRDRDRREEELQLLLATRTDYVRVQELIEELRSVYDSLSLSRAQNAYIVSRLRVGAASRLDRVESERAVLSYQIQFEQKQSELSMGVRDLLARTQNRTIGDLSRPGPAGMPNVALVLKMDSIDETLARELNLQVAPPDENHPRISAQEALAESSELQAESIKANLWPTLRLEARARPEYPNGPIPEQVFQSSVLVTATMPLFEMSQTRHLAEQKLREAASVRYARDQTQIDLVRDFAKAADLLASLRSQRELAAQDVLNSSEAARLYFQNYKAGKSQLLDVQTADNRALLAKVNKTRIEAQILNQLNLLRALSGKGVL